MTSDNTNGTGRRRLLKTSGQMLVGGFGIGSIASSASANTTLDLDLESDFNEIARSRGGQEEDGKYVRYDSRVYRPWLSTDLDRDKYRVVRVELKIGSEGLEHPGAQIKINGKNGAYLESTWPGNSDRSVGSSTSTTVGIDSAGASLSFSSSTSVTQSGLQIEDNSQPRDYFQHDYKFQGGLENNYVPIEGIAVFKLGNIEDGTDILEIEWEVYNGTKYEYPMANPSDTFTNLKFHSGSLD